VIFQRAVRGQTLRATTYSVTIAAHRRHAASVTYGRSVDAGSGNHAHQPRDVLYALYHDCCLPSKLTRGNFIKLSGESQGRGTRTRPREAEAVALREQSPAGAGSAQLSTAESARRAWPFQPDGFSLGLRHKLPLPIYFLNPHYSGVVCRHWPKQNPAAAGCGFSSTLACYRDGVHYRPDPKGNAPKR